MTLTRDAVEKMLADATPGPWRAVGENYDAVRIVTAHEMPQPDHSYGRQTVVGSSEWTHVTDEDARLIASTPDTATALLTAWDERDALMAAVQANLLRPNYVRAEAAEAKLAERDAEIARLRAQLDSTLKDRALIIAERDTAKKIADAMEGEAHAHIKLWGDALRRAEAAEAKLAECDASVAAALEEAAGLCEARAKRRRAEAVVVADPDIHIEAAGALENAAKSIRALITKPQADALARVRAEAVTVKPREHSVRVVEWVSHTDDDGNPALAHRIEQVIDGAWKPILCVGPTSVSAAQADHDARIRAAIGGAE